MVRAGTLETAETDMERRSLRSGSSPLDDDERGMLKMGQDDVRMSVLKRLAEQAMSDQQFRAVAGQDLDEALRTHGYDLNPKERDLVGRFREALEEAGVDLFLKDEISLDGIFDDATSDELERMLPQTDE